MATMTVETSLWMDPRTGIWKLRKRIPTRYRAVSGRTGDTVKITTRTADEKAAKRELSRVLAEWEAMLADWERQANVVTVTPALAQEMTALWAAWITSDCQRLELGQDDRYVFKDSPAGLLWTALSGAGSASIGIREAELLDLYADQAARLSGVTISDETRSVLKIALRPAASAAVREADMEKFEREAREAGVTDTWSKPLQYLRSTLPAVATEEPAKAPAVSLNGLYDAWKAVTGSKPRTAHDTGYLIKSLVAFLGHDDAARITREDVRRWREALKADGLNNNTWNNRLSMLRQVFEQAVRDGTREGNPAENSLRLPKTKSAERHPYTDPEARRILEAARLLDEI